MPYDNGIGIFVMTQVDFSIVKEDRCKNTDI